MTGIMTLGLRCPFGGISARTIAQSLRGSPMLNGWSSFFTLTGSAGAGLVGLLFVVVTLGADLSTSRRLDVARALMTPALISFTDVLLQGMIVLAPWPSDWPSGIL